MRFWFNDQPKDTGPQTNQPNVRFWFNGQPPVYIVPGTAPPPPPPGSGALPYAIARARQDEDDWFPVFKKGSTFIAPAALLIPFLRETFIDFEEEVWRPFYDNRKRNFFIPFGDDDIVSIFIM